MIPKTYTMTYTFVFDIAQKLPHQGSYGAIENKLLSSSSSMGTRDSEKGNKHEKRLSCKKLTPIFKSLLTYFTTRIHMQYIILSCCTTFFIKSNHITSLYLLSLEEHHGWEGGKFKLHHQLNYIAHISIEVIVKYL